jgi:hypothetical protein
LDLLENQPRPQTALIAPEMGRLLYWFVRCTRPRLVVEAGSFIGYSALCIGQALEDNGEGHLHAFDLFLDLPDYVSPVLGRCTNTLAAARGHIAQAGLAHRVTFHKGDSSAQILQTFTDRQVRLDMAFIDGDHRLRGCLKDWFAVDQLLAEDGFVLLHDTEPERAEWLGPRYLLEQLGERAAGQYQWINLCAGAGLGVIQKRTAQGLNPWWPSWGQLLTEILFNRKAGWHQK